MRLGDKQVPKRQNMSSLHTEAIRKRVHWTSEAMHAFDGVDKNVFNKQVFFCQHNNPSHNNGIRAAESDRLLCEQSSSELACLT